MATIAAEETTTQQEQDQAVMIGSDEDSVSAPAAAPEAEGPAPSRKRKRILVIDSREPSEPAADIIELDDSCEMKTNLRKRLNRNARVNGIYKYDFLCEDDMQGLEYNDDGEKTCELMEFITDECARTEMKIEDLKNCNYLLHQLCWWELRIE